jgi:hypothetical protein
MKSLALALLAVSLTILSACEENTVAEDANRLCGNTSPSLAARISGAPQPVDLCVSNDEATATYSATPSGHYLVSGDFVADGVVYSIRIGFFLQPNQPQTLSMTSDSLFAASNPGSAWFFYAEREAGSYEYGTESVTGDFRLTIGDQSVAVGTFANVEIQLESIPDRNSAGTRMISEGYFSVTPD